MEVNLNYKKEYMPFFTFYKGVYIYSKGRKDSVYQMMFTPGSSLAPKFSILECSGPGTSHFAYGHFAYRKSVGRRHNFSNLCVILPTEIGWMQQNSV
jgi:hypothetical protein